MMWLKTKISQFIRAQKAGVGILAALAIIPLIGFAGLSVDGARGYFVKSKLSQAVDAAGLAGGREVFSVTLQQDIEKYFRANFPDGFMNATVNGPYFTVSPDNETIEVIASATIPTTFMAVLGKHDITVSARTLIRRSVRGMELALVMDNTGSMRSNGKIDAMKAAATDLINILYGDQEEIQNFWVSLIPYTAAVNIGGNRFNWLDNTFDPANYNPTLWKGCVEARRTGGLDVTDDPPSVMLWPPYLYSNESDNIWPPVKEENSWKNNGTGPNLGCGPAITPLIPQKSDIQAAIAEMLPWHRGGTLTNLGLVWGWRTLSPRWRGLWGGNTPAALPLDYGDPLMDKVVIILTDGVNQFYDHPPAGPDQSDYSAYGRLGWGWLNTTNGGTFTAEVNNRMLQVCTAMKAQGITVYTITFQLNNTSTQQLFRDCASTPKFYFNSPSNEDLRDTFREIASQLSNLRIAE